MNKSVAAIQMNSGPVITENLQHASRLLDQVAASGVQLALLPENFAFMPVDEHERLAAAEQFGSGPIQDFLAKYSKTRGLYVIAGSVGLVNSDQDPRVFASCLVYSSEGVCIQRYDKVHLFDVEVSSQEAYRESAVIRPGQEVVLADTTVAKLGLSICYDLRFPELYRELSARGAQILLLPAAFTVTTGRAHWELLLRARAIENQCYVIAAAQTGHHANGRDTWGHSMIINPWGDILCQLDGGEGVITAPFDLTFLNNIRQRFPSLQHRRLQEKRGQSPFS
ncbi:MAG TPA: carbon-nitrogen hydrolase family protein [Gammaproteobacteria bacterium]|mgnify:CR=1 FL=1|nr:carbon-nitrogen hydrolase family protein [Gammaproteobacteria bacterium]